LNLATLVTVLMSGNTVDPAAEYLASIVTYSPVASYDASVSDLWQDSAGTSPAAANGDVIGRWDDISGNGYHVTQATTANKPTLRTGVQNSLPVIRSDGSDDFLRNTSFPDFSDTYTVYAVVKFATSVDTTQGVFEVSNGTVNRGFSMVMDTSTRFRTVEAGNVLKEVSKTSTRDDVFRLLRMRNTGTTIQMWTNGVSNGTTAYTAPNANTLSVLDMFRLVGLASYTLAGDIAHLSILNTGHDDATMAAFEALVNTRYAVY
jgi:hypothetical protein